LHRGRSNSQSMGKYKLQKQLEASKQVAIKQKQEIIEKDK